MFPQFNIYKLPTLMDIGSLLSGIIPVAKQRNGENGRRVRYKQTGSYVVARRHFNRKKPHTNSVKVTVLTSFFRTETYRVNTDPSSQECVRRRRQMENWGRG